MKTLEGLIITEAKKKSERAEKKLALCLEQQKTFTITDVLIETQAEYDHDFFYLLFN